MGSTFIVVHHTTMKVPSKKFIKYVFKICVCHVLYGNSYVIYAMFHADCTHTILIILDYQLITKCLFFLSFFFLSVFLSFFLLFLLLLLPLFLFLLLLLLLLLLLRLRRRRRRRKARCMWNYWTYLKTICASTDLFLEPSSERTGDKLPVYQSIPFVFSPFTRHTFQHVMWVHVLDSDRRREGGGGVICTRSGRPINCHNGLHDRQHSHPVSSSARLPPSCHPAVVWRSFTRSMPDCVITPLTISLWPSVKIRSTEVTLFVKIHWECHLHHVTVGDYVDLLAQFRHMALRLYPCAAKSVSIKRPGPRATSCCNKFLVPVNITLKLFRFFLPFFCESWNITTISPFSSFVFAT